MQLSLHLKGRLRERVRQSALFHRCASLSKSSWFPQVDFEIQTWEPSRQRYGPNNIACLEALFLIKPEPHI